MFITLHVIDPTGTVPNTPARIAPSTVMSYFQSFSREGDPIPGETIVNFTDGTRLYAAHSVEEIDRIIKQAEQSRFN